MIDKRHMLDERRLMILGETTLISLAIIYTMHAEGDDAAASIARTNGAAPHLILYNEN